jgi:hypothetical protein
MRAAAPVGSSSTRGGRRPAPPLSGQQGQDPQHGAGLAVPGLPLMTAAPP